MRKRRTQEERYVDENWDTNDPAILLRVIRFMLGTTESEDIRERVKFVIKRFNHHELMRGSTDECNKIG